MLFAQADAPVTFVQKLDKFFGDAVSAVWNVELIVMLAASGILLSLLALGGKGIIQFKGFFHAIKVVRGKYDDPNDPGEISHFQALCTALSATVGLGNISGVAVAIGVNPLSGETGSVWGQLAIVLATLFYALAGVWGRVRLSSYQAVQGACGMLLCSAVLSVPLALLLARARPGVRSIARAQ